MDGLFRKKTVNIPCKRDNFLGLSCMTSALRQNLPYLWSYGWQWVQGCQCLLLTMAMAFSFTKLTSVPSVHQSQRPRIGFASPGRSPSPSERLPISLLPSVNANFCLIHLLKSWRDSSRNIIPHSVLSSLLDHPHPFFVCSATVITPGNIHFSSLIRIQSDG